MSQDPHDDETGRDGRPLRVLHVLSHDRVKSGGAFQALLLAREQRRRGTEVALVHHLGRDPAAARAAFAPAAAEGIPCVGVPMSGWRSIWGRRRLRDRVREFAPDVVHTHRERALVFALRALGAGAPPVVAQKGNSYRSRADAAAAYRDPRVGRVICVAAAVRDVVVAQDGVPPERAVVVYGSFDPDRFRMRLDVGESRAALGLPPGAPLVGILANIDRKKGHDVFLEAAARVSGARADALFAVAGGGDLDGLRAAADALGLGDRVRLLGFRGDAERVLSALDVSVNTSVAGEGLTGAIRESLALGVPVICTDVGGNRELVRNGDTGWIVDRGDVDGLAAAIREALDDPAEAARRAAAGRAQVLAEMSGEVRGRRTQAVYRAAIEAVGARRDG